MMKSSGNKKMPIWQGWNPKQRKMECQKYSRSEAAESGSLQLSETISPTRAHTLHTHHWLPILSKRLSFEDNSVSSSIVPFPDFPLLCAKNYIIQIAPLLPLPHPYYLHSLLQRAELIDFHSQRFHLRSFYLKGLFLWPVPINPHKIQDL